MAFTRSEISERHLIGAADLCIHLVNLSRESIWRKPFRHRIWIKECAIYFIRRGTEQPSDAITVVWPTRKLACMILFSKPGGTVPGGCGSGLSLKRIIISTSAPRALRQNSMASSQFQLKKR